MQWRGGCPAHPVPVLAGHPGKSTTTTFKIQIDIILGLYLEEEPVEQGQVGHSEVIWQQNGPEDRGHVFNNSSHHRCGDDRKPTFSGLSQNQIFDAL